MLGLLTIDRHRPRPTFFVTPLLCVRRLPGRWGVTKGSQDAAWFLRFAGICPNCVALE
jgi:hypothetical protein